MTVWDGKGGSPWLYAKAASGAIDCWRCWAENGSVVVVWGQLNGAQQTKSFKCKPKNVGRANATTIEEQAEKEALAKFQKQLKKKYFLTVESAQSTLNFKPMLAKSFHDRRGKVLFPADVQPKFDGVRCLAHWVGNCVELMSRGGDPYRIPHIQVAFEETLEKGDVMDGEVYCHGISRQTITSWAKRLQPDTSNLVFCAYDFIEDGFPDDLWEVRRDKLAAWFYEHGAAVHGGIEHVFTQLVQSPEEVKHYHDQFVQSGYEGAIVRLLKGMYKFGHRSSELLKYKEFDDDEFEVLGWTVGKGDWENVPIFRCKTKDGKLFDVPPKGSMVARAQMLKEADSYVGRRMNVRYFGFTDEGVPSFPVGCGIREEGT